MKRAVPNLPTPKIAYKDEYKNYSMTLGIKAYIMMYKGGYMSGKKPY